MLKSKKKRMHEEDSTDLPCPISFEKSNRQEAKKEIRKQLNEKKDEEDLSELIWEAEMALSSSCREKGGECTCPLPEQLSKEELLKILGRA